MAKNNALMSDLPLIQQALGSSNNYTLDATTNTTFASTSLNNPYGLLFDDGKPLYGVERIMFGGLSAITDPADTPYDSSGKPGYYIVDGKTGLVRKNIRAYGSWIFNTLSAYGNYIASSVAADYLSITSIFNKINTLVLNGGATSCVESIYLNGVDTTNNITHNISAVIDGLNYPSNVNLPANIGTITVGLNTVKLLKDNAVNSYLTGIELISYDTSYPNNINVPSGVKVIEGKKITMPAFTGVNGLNYKGSISNSGQLYAGTKGARVAWFPSENGYYVSKYTGITETSQAGTVFYNTTSSDTIGLTDSSQFYANSQGNIVRVKDATSVNRLLLVPTAAPSGTELTFAKDYDGSTDTTLFAGNLQYRDDGTTGSVIADTTAVTVELYGRVLANADHSNEEMYREIHWRDFGCGRSDDFSTLQGTSTARVFTLDDGMTSLIASGAYTGGEDLIMTDTTSLMLTFVGTGLDITDYVQNSSMACSMYIDGIYISGTYARTGGIVKLVSDLPYGLHTFRIINSAGGGRGVLTSFRVYQPKTPVLTGYQPELAYNIMADFVATNLPSRFQAGGWMPTPFVDQGMLAKVPVREAVYSNNSWSYIAASTGYAIGGSYIRGVTSNAGSLDYSIYGATNYRFMWWGYNNADTWDILVDDSLKVDELVSSSFGGSGQINLLRTDMGSLGAHKLTLRRGNVNSNNNLDFFGVMYSTPIYEPSTWNTNPYLDYFISGTGVGDYRKSGLVTITKYPREYYVISTVADSLDLSLERLLALLVLDKGTWRILGTAFIQAPSGASIYTYIRVDGTIVSTTAVNNSSGNDLDTHILTKNITLTKKSAVSIHAGVSASAYIRSYSTIDNPKIFAVKISD